MVILLVELDPRWRSVLVDAGGVVVGVRDPEALVEVLLKGRVEIEGLEGYRVVEDAHGLGSTQRILNLSRLSAT